MCGDGVQGVSLDEDEPEVTKDPDVIVWALARSRDLLDVC